jgi:hypothetical protein
MKVDKYIEKYILIEQHMLHYEDMVHLNMVYILFKKTGHIHLKDFFILFILYL